MSATRESKNKNVRTKPLVPMDEHAVRMADIWQKLQDRVAREHQNYKLAAS